MVEKARRPAPQHGGKPIRARRADWLTELVWKRVLQLTVLYPKDALLDMACTDGELLRRIGRRSSAQLSGICATPQMARTARHRVPEADIMYAEMDDFPWLNDSFDVALCALSIPAMREPSVALAEAHRVLRTGGQLVLAARWLPWPLRPLANRLLVDGTEDSAALLSRRALRAALQEAGFTRTRFLLVGGLACVCLCWKP